MRNRQTSGGPVTNEWMNQYGLLGERVTMLHPYFPSSLPGIDLNVEIVAGIVQPCTGWTTIS
jgi:hypothetical protein